MGITIITILQQGSIALIGSRITKAMKQKEISDLIAAGGWAVVGVTIIENIILPLTTWILGISGTAGGFIDKIKGIIDFFTF